jgi:protein-disulfide isomerase
MGKPSTPLQIVVLAILVVTPEWVAAQSVMPSEIASIKSDVELIKNELTDVKRQLAEVLRSTQQRLGQDPANGSASRVQARVTDAPVLGRADAPVTLVDFSDYQCPYCRKFFSGTLPTLKSEYIDTGKLRYVFRDYPLDQIHPQAHKAAEAAHCAGEQGKYWEMHDLLFQNQQTLASPQLSEHARTLGLDGAAFDACLESAKYAQRIKDSLSDGEAAGIQGTPGFVVAKTQPGDSVEGTPVRGAQPVDAFRKIIDELLAEN